MPKVISLSKDDQHQFSKRNCDSLDLLTGLGVEGDAHCGATVKHRSRVRADAEQPNLRQVHLIHSELLSELQDKGFNVRAGTLGENILTKDLNVLALPRNSLLKIGKDTVLRVTGLRNPCAQLDNFQQGLTKACLDQDGSGGVRRKAGVMAVVEAGGTIYVNDVIIVEYPPEPFEALEPV
ncbi:MAG: MOSC domain-containing protein [Pseudohongiella sp.]|nr:MOSC domain-containing protein [Pseudohongiella sp.]